MCVWARFRHGVSDVCQINDLDHSTWTNSSTTTVSDVCQINDLDHNAPSRSIPVEVSDVCQINDLDHFLEGAQRIRLVSDVCQINDLDPSTVPMPWNQWSFGCLKRFVVFRAREVHYC